MLRLYNYHDKDASTCSRSSSTRQKRGLGGSSLSTTTRPTCLSLTRTFSYKCHFPYSHLWIPYYSDSYRQTTIKRQGSNARYMAPGAHSTLALLTSQCHLCGPQNSPHAPCSEAAWPSQSLGSPFASRAWRRCYSTTHSGRLNTQAKHLLHIRVTVFAHPPRHTANLCVSPFFNGSG